MPEFQSRVIPAGEEAAASLTPEQDPKSVAEAPSLAIDKEKAGNAATSLSSLELARDQAAERALARAKEYDKIHATDKDEWYYIQDDQQFGPVPLDELKAKIADLSISPPIRLCWHEGMTEWKPVHQISQICGVSPLAATQFFKLPTPARRPGDNG
jgi:hypothetical protein